jgi:hypothetical protein
MLRMTRRRNDGWYNIGNVGDLYVKVDPSSGKILLGFPSGGIGFSSSAIAVTVLDAAYLAVLLGEAIALAKGEGTKLSPSDSVIEEEAE